MNILTETAARLANWEEIFDNCLVPHKHSGELRKNIATRMKMRTKQQHISHYRITGLPTGTRHPINLYEGQHLHVSWSLYILPE